MKKIYILFAFFTLLAISAKLPAQDAPGWVDNLEQAFPGREWVAVAAQGSSQPAAEAAAMNALARAFKTDVASLAQTSQRFSQIVSSRAGSKNIRFEASSNISQDMNTSSNIRGLIGVQLDVYRSPDSAVYVNARMNRGECAQKYADIINENAAIIDRLLESAATVKAQITLDVYANLSFAYAIATVTDNFINILEVLEPQAAKRRQAYGNANTIKTKMAACAALITIGITVNAEEADDAALFTRATGSFFRDLGFRVNEQGQGTYALLINIRFEEQKQAVSYSRYYLDAALASSSETAVFIFTEDDRKAHPGNASEARRLAVRAVETSLREGNFAKEFNNWLNSLLD